MKYVAMYDLKVKFDLIKNMKEMIEARYLRFCDPSPPLQQLILFDVRV